MRKILISQRVFVNQYGVKCDLLEQDYMEYFTKLGYAVIPVSNFNMATIPWINSIGVDGMVFSGGGNLRDEYYVRGHSPSNLGLPLCDEERDNVESIMLDYAIKNDIPILGICRGMQYLNACFGGKVRRLDSPKGRLTHNIIGKDLVFPVNSYHDYGVGENDVAANFEVIFWEEGTRNVEAIQHVTKKIIALMWHPERTLPTSHAELYCRKLINEHFGG